MAIISDFLFPSFLFALVFCGAVVIVYGPNQMRDIPLTASYPCYHLACLWEDAPAASLKGQSYPLATPLMTPLACILKQTWQIYYWQNLRQPGISYWQWRDKPEAKNICQELSLLLDLPQPKPQAEEILQSLAEGKYIFWEKEKRLALESWQSQVQKSIGKSPLEAIYRVCYGTTWQNVQQILHPLETTLLDTQTPWWKILGVKKSANPSQVEIAYKQLIKTWHPDLNSHPQATQMTSIINVAYSEYKLLKQKPANVPQKQQVNMINHKLLIAFILRWLKPSLSK